MTTTLDEAPVKAEPSALEKLLRSDYTIQHEMWKNILFTDRGMARLQHTIGFFKGLQMCGKDDLATELAESLCGWLTRLNDYGGVAEIDMATDGHGCGGGILKTPAYRIELSDDGTFGGFGVLWYRYVTPKRWQECLAADPRQDGEEWRHWYDRVCEKRKCRKDLELYRYYYPVRDGKEKENMESEVIQYTYSMNGGLLFHGFGNQTYSVDLMASMGQKVWWSIHT